MLASVSDRHVGKSKGPFQYGQLHHPEGPYGYEYGGIHDPFWTEDRRSYHEEAGFSTQAGWPLFRRGFDPDEAHLKVGPIYFQAVSIEAGLLYSDYDGPQVFAPGREDGFLSFGGFRLRATSRVAANLFFEIDGEIIYLPGENQVGLRTVNGIGIGAPFLSLNYLTEWGEWDVRIHDELGTYMPFDLRAGGDAIDWAGRYHFGWEDYRNAGYGYLFDPVVYNLVGIQANRLIAPDWRLSLEADHTDYFYIDSYREDDHRSLEHIGARLGAEPVRILFTPYVQYDSWWDSDSDRVTHSAYVGGGGRLTKRIDADARVGYYWEDQDRGFSSFSREGWLWSVGLRHRIAERTSHGVYFGQDHFINEFSGSSVVSEFVNYCVRHEISERLDFYGFAQWSRDDFRGSRGLQGDFDREIYGLRLDYQVCDNVRAYAGYRVEYRDQLDGFDREIYDLGVDARVAERTSCYFRYQFENADIFDEDLYLTGVRRYF